MIFSQNLFRRPTPTSLSVEIGNPISLCWGPAMIEKFVIGVFSFG